MKLSIRTALRSLSLLALTVGFMPGCDSEEYESLGLSSEEIDVMSEEELDELAALEADADDLGHSVNTKGLAMPVHPGHPGPSKGPHDLASTVPSATHAGFETKDSFWGPIHTHEQLPAATDDRGTPVHPTHDAPLAFKLDVFDPGCQPKPDDVPVLANRS